MKVIFLDIDGVVNCSTTKERIHGLIGVEQQKIALVKQIVHATGAKLVLSSTWRIGWFYEDTSTHNTDVEEWHYLCDEFHKQGLEFLDHTPLHKDRHRGREIQEWLDNCNEEIEAYVVIDDDMWDIRELHKHHMVKTSYGYGLLPVGAEMAIQILNKDDKKQDE
jgi:hypothetical protein